MNLASTVYHPMGCTPDSCTPTIRFTQLYQFHPLSAWRKQKTDFFTSALISVSSRLFRSPPSDIIILLLCLYCVFSAGISVSFKYLFWPLKKKKKTWPTFHSILFPFIIKPLESFTDACFNFFKSHLLFNPLWFGWYSLPTPMHYHQSCSGKAICWDFCYWIQ